MERVESTLLIEVIVLLTDTSDAIILLTSSLL